VTAPSACDLGLELFIMERELVLHEEAIAHRRRRRVLRATGAVIVAGVLASGTGLAAAGTTPLPAARSAIEFLFPGEPLPSGELEPEVPATTPIETPDAVDPSAAPTDDAAPSNAADAATLDGPAAASPGNSANAPGHAPDGSSTAPGNSGAHGNPSPPGQAKAHGNPNPPGQMKKG
jgi:hypothetical protein